MFKIFGGIEYQKYNSIHKKQNQSLHTVSCVILLENKFSMLNLSGSLLSQQESCFNLFLHEAAPTIEKKICDNNL